MGLRRPRDVRLDGGALDRGGGARARSTSRCRGHDGPWGDALVEAVRDGRVPEAAIDAKVRRILRLAARVGALEGVPPAVASPPEAPEAEPLLREASAAGMVLVRNEDAALPLDRGALSASRCSARTRRPPARRAAGARRSTPTTSSRRSTGCATRSATASSSSTRSARGSATAWSRCGSTRSATRSPGEPGVRVRYLGADGGVVQRGAALHRQARLARRAHPARGRDDRGRGAAAGERAGHVRGRRRRRGPVPRRGRRRGPRRRGRPAGAGLRPVLRLPRPAAAIGRGRARARPRRARARAPRDRARPDARVADARRRPARARRGRGARARGGAARRRRTWRSSSSGTTEAIESEGFDRRDLALPGAQDELVRRVAAASPRTVVVVNAGAPVLLPWRDEVAAVLLTWFGGQEFGAALADVLLGAVEPGGRLPTTWPAREEDVPDPVDAAGRRPARVQRGPARRLPRVGPRRRGRPPTRSATGSATRRGTTRASTSRRRRPRTRPRA